MATLLLLLTLVALPALAGLLAAGKEFAPGRFFPWRKLAAGAPIVYRIVETSTSPGQNAREIHPAERGEFYYYVTDKYWRVEKIQPDGMIVARSSLMEQHFLRPDDPNLRRASFFERLRHGNRFPLAPEN